MSPDIALRASGLFRVSVSTPSSKVANKSSVPVSICVVMLFPRVVNAKAQAQRIFRERSFAKGPFNDDRTNLPTVSKMPPLVSTCP